MPSAVSPPPFSLSPLHANLFQLFHPMGGVLARPLSSARPKEGAIANNIITDNIRTTEKPKRIASIPFKPRNVSNPGLGHSTSLLGGPLPPGYFGRKVIFIQWFARCRCRQNIHSKWSTAKILVIKKLAPEGVRDFACFSIYICPVLRMGG